MPKNSEDKEKSGSLVAFLIVLIFVLIWISVFALLIKFDAGNLGTTLRPYWKDVPVLRLILPKVSDEQIKQEEQYPYRNLDEAIDAIKDMQAEIDRLTNANEDLALKVAELTAENNRLKVYEENLKEFEERVAKFEQYVVFNSKAPELSEYKSFYEAMYPDNAAAMYQKILELDRITAAFEQLVNSVAQMKPAEAATTLEDMNADIGLVVAILRNMKRQNAVDILNKMDALYRAKIFQRWVDLDSEEYEELIKSLYIDYPG